MRQKALQRILGAIESRTRGYQNFSARNNNWIGYKMRPTQFNTSKNFPDPTGKYWEKEVDEPKTTA